MHAIKRAALLAALSFVASASRAQAVHPAQAARLRWYPANSSGAIVTVSSALGIAFDGANCGRRWAPARPSCDRRRGLPAGGRAGVSPRP
jgi:hypothetical protein